MEIREILDTRRVVLDVQGSSKREILAQLAGPVADAHPGVDHETLVEVLVQREETSTTAIADGIAIPHGKLDIGEEVLCAFGRSRDGIEFDSVDGSPTHLLFLLVSPASHPSLHLRWLAHLAVLLKNPDFRQNLLDAESTEDVLKVIAAEEQRRISDQETS